jgi:hypothetical protein
MALKDLEAFLRQIAAEWDPGMDVSVGSPFDTRVIQRVLRRLGTDPFTVDMATFAQTRLKQAYPDGSFDEGGALTDLFVKPVTLLFDPMTRETARISRAQSFRDPDILTGEEAEALGSNLFATRTLGKYARGVGRMLFQQPKNVGITPNNYFTSKEGLHFFPTETQSIRAEEMLLNVDSDGNYYFDVNLLAESPGATYNISPKSLVSIANVPSVVRVTNIKKFQEGENEETPAEFIARAQGELTERSLVALRGIAAKLTRSFPDLQRLNVVGFNDPEMQRDIISGGSLGDILISGVAGSPVADGEGAAGTRRFYTLEVDFTVELGSIGPVEGYVITIFGAIGALNFGRDFALTRIVSPNEVDVDEQILLYTATGCSWSVRKREITLSGIPGGILFPNTAQGTVTIEPDQIHIGGSSDIYLRGSELEEATLTLESVVDDDPILQGLTSTLVTPNVVYLDDLQYNVNYFYGDSTYLALENSGFFGYTLQIRTGVNAGSYRIISIAHWSGAAPAIEITPDLPNPPLLPTAGGKWRLVDELTIDLVDPKETLISGSDLQKSQYSAVVTTAGGTDFDVYGVAEGDILRILEGADAGDYALVEDPLVPGFVKLRVEKVMSSTESGVSYTVLRQNVAGGIKRPLIRLKSVELLDSSNQPQGTLVPYAKPVDVQSRTFQNPSRGVKHDLVDVTLGLISQPLPLPSFPFSGTLDFYDFDVGLLTAVIVAAIDLTDLIGQINAGLVGYGKGDVALLVGADRVGIRPFGAGGRVVVVGGTARAAFFGNTDFRTTSDIRSASVPDWGLLDPAIDFVSGLDVFQIIAGNNIGFYRDPYTLGWTGPGVGAALPSEAVILGENDTSLSNATCFAPEATVHLQVGARSLGSARCYFLEPTTIEFDQDSYFTTEAEAGTVRFFPDPSLDTQLLPAIPGDIPITDGTVTAPSDLTSVSQDFSLSRVRPGDELRIVYWPLGGDIALVSPVNNLVGKTLIYSVDNGVERTLTFIRDDITLLPTQVSLTGAIEQINASFGMTVCALTGANELEFVADLPIVISAAGTANALLLGNIKGTFPLLSFALANDVQRSNRAPYYGTYTIDSLLPTVLTVQGPLTLGVDFATYTTPGARLSYQVFRSGVQRISTTDMRSKVAEASLYYFDVELVSEGTGDLWNISSDKQMTVEGYRSDGWYLTTADENLSFSEVEDVTLVLSRTILPDGVDDNPVNSVQLTGQNLYLTYERAPLVVDTQGYVSSDIERVVCSSTLARYLIPYYVRLDVKYVGGSKVDVVLPELEKYIKDLYPVDVLESSQIQKIFLNRGATAITNPLDLLALVYSPSRDVTTRRSQNSIGVDSRLCTFVPDVLNVVRNVS